MRQIHKRKRAKFNSVQEYLASLDPRKERTLRTVIGFILMQFPELESKISWNVAAIHSKGKYVVGICAYKNHLTFSPWSFRIMEDFKARLEKFVLFKKQWRGDGARTCDLCGRNSSRLHLGRLVPNRSPRT
jgi:uncharacterized protein